MPAINQPAYGAKSISTTTTVYTGSGVIGGIFVSSGTGVTVQIQDGATTLMATATLPVGWYPFPAGFSTSLVVTLGGTSPVVSVLWAPN